MLLMQFILLIFVTPIVTPIVTPTQKVQKKSGFAGDKNVVSKSVWMCGQVYLCGMVKKEVKWR